MYHATVDEMLEAWDSDELIWSILMGGLGPGYEQAIQTAAVEFARAGKDYEVLADEEEDNKLWDKLCYETLTKIDKDLGGITGAMYGAARWLAYQWVTIGPEALLARAKEENDGADRIIQVHRSYPRGTH